MGIFVDIACVGHELASWTLLVKLAIDVKSRALPVPQVHLPRPDGLRVSLGGE